MSFPIPPAQTLIGKIKRTVVATKIQAFIYDFTKDGGAAGTYGTGITIPGPNLAILQRVTYRIITGITGGGGASINVGWAGALTAIDTQAAPIAANISSGWLTGVATAPGFPILFTIAGAALTAGKVVIAIEYIDEPVN